MNYSGFPRCKSKLFVHPNDDKNDKMRYIVKYSSNLYIGIYHKAGSYLKTSFIKCIVFNSNILYVSQMNKDMKKLFL